MHEYQTDGATSITYLKAFTRQSILFYVIIIIIPIRNRDILSCYIHEIYLIYNSTLKFRE